jgi:hypothetical protein
MKSLGGNDGRHEKRIDVYVCKPDIGITKNLNAVFVQFEVMDKDTLEGTGKSHGVAMTTEDAMQLLHNLDFLRRRFELPLPSRGSD